MTDQTVNAMHWHHQLLDEFTVMRVAELMAGVTAPLWRERLHEDSGKCLELFKIS